MKAPPAVRPSTQPSTRRDEKQGRESGGTKRVRIVSDYGVVDTCSTDDSRLQRYLEARNAELIRNHKGRVVAIKLHSAGNDFGHLGERWGNSNITTMEQPLECGPLLQHKPSGRYLSPRHAQ